MLIIGVRYVPAFTNSTTLESLGTFSETEKEKLASTALGTFKHGAYPCPYSIIDKIYKAASSLWGCELDVILIIQNDVVIHQWEEELWPIQSEKIWEEERE